MSAFNSIPNQNVSLSELVSCKLSIYDSEHDHVHDHVHVPLFPIGFKDEIIEGVKILLTIYNISAIINDGEIIDFIITESDSSQTGGAPPQIEWPDNPKKFIVSNKSTKVLSNIIKFVGMICISVIVSLITVNISGAYLNLQLFNTNTEVSTIAKTLTHSMNDPKTAELVGLVKQLDSLNTQYGIGTPVLDDTNALVVSIQYDIAQIDKYNNGKIQTLSPTYTTTYSNWWFGFDIEYLETYRANILKRQEGFNTFMANTNAIRDDITETIGSIKETTMMEKVFNFGKDITTIHPDGKSALAINRMKATLIKSILLKVPNVVIQHTITTGTIPADISNVINTYKSIWWELVAAHALAIGVIAWATKLVNTVCDKHIYDPNQHSLKEVAYKELIEKQLNDIINIYGSIVTDKLEGHNISNITKTNIEKLLFPKFQQYIESCKTDNDGIVVSTEQLGQFIHNYIETIDTFITDDIQNQNYPKLNELELNNKFKELADNTRLLIKNTGGNRLNKKSKKQKKKSNKSNKSKKQKKKSNKSNKSKKQKKKSNK